MAERSSPTILGMKTYHSIFRPNGRLFGLNTAAKRGCICKKKREVSWIGFD